MQNELSSPIRIFWLAVRSPSGFVPQKVVLLVAAIAAAVVATDAAAPVGAGPGNLSGQRQIVK